MLEYSNSYSMTGSLWHYHRDVIDGVDDKTSSGKSFVCKKIIGKTTDWPT